MLTYGFQIWYEDIREKKSYLAELRKMQRKILIALTRVYKRTSHQRLLKVLDLPDIESELEILLKADRLECDEKRVFKKREREISVNQIDVCSYEDYRDEIESSRHRYTLWCLTETGPFANYLNVIFPNHCHSKICRYCQEHNETAEHLLFDCKLIQPQLKGDLETNCHLLVNKLIREQNFVFN